MQYNLLKCKYCGGYLDFAVSVPSAECPYCGQSMTNQSAHTAAASFDAIIPIKCGRQQFQENTLAFLAEGELTPDDLLINFKVNDDLHAVYAPFCRYVLSYSGTMSCEVGLEEVHYVRVRQGDQYVDEKRTEIVWEPLQRNFSGNKTQDVCLAGRIDENLVFNIPTATETQTLSGFAPELLGTYAIEHAVDKVDMSTVFQVRGYPRLSSFIDKLAESGAPSRYRNMHVTFDYTVDQETMFLSGIWLQTYSYKNQSYQIAMDAGTGKVFGYRPEDSDRRKWQAELTKLGHQSWLPAIVNGLIWMLSGLGIFVAAAILGLGYYTGFSLRKRVSKNSQEFRQELLQILKSSERQVSLNALKSRAEAEYSAIRARQTMILKFFKRSIWGSMAIWAVIFTFALIIGNSRAH